ncbi:MULTISPECIES: hypothetical protein [unclassified Streptomyces]|uniref:hypothetical protein n=1 Tax=unclassified Streptomyces TaxID=2593676 RepID=UPI00068BD69D|nr:MULTISPECIES: hypothetical protein [unclassified Streptomyces]
MSGPAAAVGAWVTVCSAGPAEQGAWVTMRPVEPAEHDARVTMCPVGPAGGPAVVRAVPLPPAAVPPAAVPCACPWPSGCRHAPGPFPCDVHLRVAAEGAGPARLREFADVLVGRVPLPPGPARLRALALLARYPGCRTVAVPVRAAAPVVGVRDRTGELRWVRPGPAGAPPSPQLAGSLAHAWLTRCGTPGAPATVAGQVSGGHSRRSRASTRAASCGFSVR